MNKKSNLMKLGTAAKDRAETDAERLATSFIAFLSSINIHNMERDRLHESQNSVKVKSCGPLNLTDDQRERISMAYPGAILQADSINGISYVIGFDSHVKVGTKSHGGELTSRSDVAVELFLSLFYGGSLYFLATHLIKNLMI